MILVRILGVLLKGALAVAALALPVLGVWFASSMAAYANGPRWAIALAGLLLFPIGPVAWEVWWRMRSHGRPILTLSDRLILRTFVINGAFVGGLLAIRPEAAVRAVAARGDWMLDGSRSPIAAQGRTVLHRTADAFEWVYRLARHSTFQDDRPVAKKDDAPMPRADRTVEPDPSKEKEPPPPPPRAPEPPPMPKASAWPFDPTLHPLVSTVPPEAEKSISALAHYVVQNEPDPVLRFKALHDWVADRVAYDGYNFSHNRKHLPPQDAPSVFAARVGVCAGYARLLQSLGKAAGYEIETVVGVAKGANGEVDGGGHAWNAVKLNNAWHLVDATWNAGTVDGEKFVKRYRTAYFLTPAEIFFNDHFPDQPKWQLVQPPLSRGDFMRKPQLTPQFFAMGLRLEQPTQSQVTVNGAFEVVIDNPQGRYLMVESMQKGATAFERCDAHPGGTPTEFRATCSFSKKGNFRVVLFEGAERYGSYQWVGELGVLTE